VVPIDPATRIGAVHLTISDLNRSIEFYESRLGFRLLQRDASTARLGAAGGHSELLVLTESRTASPRVRGTTGLYHFAILVPSRRDLAASLRRLIDMQVVMQGTADHGVSEALYLADPDGNGIEIYRDRTRSEWPVIDGRLQMGIDPLDVGDLIRDDPGAEAPWSGLPSETTIGHVHLHVADLGEARRFYVDVLGFDLMQQYGRTAIFVSAGGYHHHIALNTWAGVGAPPPPPGAIGLSHFEVRMSSQKSLDDVADRLAAAQIVIERTDSQLTVDDPSGNRAVFMA
jgi:catechol 2,3-dioxygenase